MKVSIVIPNWNTTELLVNCLKAIQKSNLKLDYEIIIVDNASEDEFGEALVLRGVFKKCRIIQNRRNLGFSVSIVQGLLISEGKHVCFLNSDTEPAEGWLDYLVEYLESDPKCGLVAPSAHHVCCREQAPEVNIGKNIEIKGETIPFMCVVIPKRMFYELGLPVVRYGEDIEYGNRLRNNGYKTVIVAKAYVKHVGSMGWVLNQIGRSSQAQQDYAREMIEKKWLGE